MVKILGDVKWELNQVWFLQIPVTLVGLVLNSDFLFVFRHTGARGDLKVQIHPWNSCYFPGNMSIFKTLYQLMTNGCSGQAQNGPSVSLTYFQVIPGKDEKQFLVVHGL